MIYDRSSINNDTLNDADLVNKNTNHNSGVDSCSCWLWGRLLSLLGEESVCAPVAAADEDDNDEEVDKDSSSPSTADIVLKFTKLDFFHAE